MAWPNSNAWLRTLVPLFLYLAFSFSFFSRHVNLLDYYYGYTADALIFIWFLHWWPFAISHGLNPFICKYVWFPGGFNFAWATALPFFAILMWPVTVLGSPILSYNLLVLSAPALAAWTAFMLCRELGLPWVVSLVCGYLFGFSATELSLMLELNLGSVFLIPFAVLLCVRHMQGRLNRWPFVVLLGLTLVAQIGIATEVLTSLCLVGALTWCIFLLFAPACERGKFWRLAMDIAIAAPLTMCLAAPFMYYVITGLPGVPAQINPLWVSFVDARRFLLPQVPVYSFWSVFQSLVRQVKGITAANVTCVSGPLLLILLFYFCRHIRQPYVRALLAVLCIVAVLSLGPVLLINGKVISALPWSALCHVPIIRSMIPVRLQTYFTLGAAVAAAFWLAEAKTLASRLPRFALAALACLCLRPAEVEISPVRWQTQPFMESGPTFEWSRWPEQPFFAPAHIRKALGPMPNVILLPVTSTGPGMAWQLNAGMSFTQAEGYVGFRPVREQKWAMLENSFLGAVQPDFHKTFQAFCAAQRVDYILIGPGTPPSTVSAIEGLGWAHHIDDGIEVVKVPQA